MNVWIMNLKDNRDTAAPDGTEKKFSFCKEREILGIGWVGYDPENSGDAAFLKAHSLLNNFCAGDLVWVHNKDKEYYLCRITEKAQHTDDAEFNQNDISEFCRCKFFYVGKDYELLEGITMDDISSRSAVSPGTQEIKKNTEKYFSRISCESIPETDVKVVNPKKSIKKKAVIITSISAVLLASLIIFVLLRDNYKTPIKTLIDVYVYGNVDKAKKMLPKDYLIKAEEDEEDIYELLGIEDIEDCADELAEYYGDDFKVSYEVKNLKTLSKKQLSEFRRDIKDASQYDGDKVKEVKKFDIKLKYKSKDGLKVKTETLEDICSVKIKNKWYLCFDDGYFVALYGLY